MKKFLKNLFLKNWPLKLFSFILALILWLTLIPEEKIFQEKTLTLSLEVQNTPPNMELVEKPQPPLIDVKIRAPRSLINNITSDNVYAVLNLEKASLQQEEYPLNESMISIPSGAEVIEIRPSQVNLKLEKSIEIMLDVEPDIIGIVKEGFKIGGWRVDPPQVLVKGPESKLKDTYKVRTSPIDISEITQTTEFEADLILPNPDVSLASSKTKVKVIVQIQEIETKDKNERKKENPEK